MTRQQVGWYDGSRVHQMHARPVGVDPLPRHLEHTANWVPVTVGDDTQDSDWQPIATAPDDELVVVFYLQKEGDEEVDIHTLDFKEDGHWFYHGEHFEHYMAVGGAGAAGPDMTCVGPAETAPYTHWKRLGTPSIAAPTSPALNPAALADAKRFGERMSADSLEVGDPA